MIIIPDPSKPWLRDTITLEPTFGCVSQTITLRAFRRMQFLNPDTGVWEFLPDGRPAVDCTISADQMVDPATMMFVEEGGVSAVGFMVLASARQIGISNLDEGALYDAIGIKLEQLVVANSLA